jgi:hypothetical protein
MTPEFKLRSEDSLIRRGEGFEDDIELGSLSSKQSLFKRIARHLLEDKLIREEDIANEKE